MHGNYSKLSLGIYADHIKIKTEFSVATLAAVATSI